MFFVMKSTLRSHLPCTPRGVAPNVLEHYTQVWVSRASTEATEHKSVCQSPGMVQTALPAPFPLPSKQLEAQGQAGLSNLYSAEGQ